MSSTRAWLEQADLLTSDKWNHGWTTREGPSFLSAPDSVEHSASAEILTQAVGLKAGAWVRQVHGGQVLKATEAGFAGEADALWSDQSGLGVIGRGADCPLILVGGVRNDQSRVWGFAHASWRSTLEGITAGLVQAMTRAGAEPVGMKAVICPSAGPCCYEVGKDVHTAAMEKLGPGAAWFFTEKLGSVTFDLWAANTAQLTAAGLDEKNIHNVGHCTICGGDLFPSHRRQAGQADRFAAIIGA